MDIAAHEDLRQSEEYGKFISRIGWHVEKILNTKSEILNKSKIQNSNYINIFIRKLGPFGAIAKMQRVTLPLPWEEIQKVLKENRVWMTKLEPLSSTQDSVLSAQGFGPDGNSFLCSKTIQVDLRDIKLKKDARYCLRKAQSSKVAKVQSNNFNEFYEMWRKANGIKHLWTPGKKDFDNLVSSFGNKCFCVTIGELAHLRQGFGGQAGALVLMHDKVAYYYYAGALSEGKKLELPYLVVWECMQEAKKRGCKVWDFEGIYDKRWPNKSILGYSHFKQSFGGEIVEFPGSFTKWGW